MDNLFLLAATLVVITVAVLAHSRPRLSIAVVVLLAAGGTAVTFVTDSLPSLGIDLKGGVSVVLQPTETVSGESLDVAVDIIRARVDSIGVAEPDIRRQGGDIIVELPGVKDGERALELVGRPGFVALRPVLGTLAELPEVEGQDTPELGVDDESGSGFYPGLPDDPAIYLLAPSQTRGDVFSNDAQADIVTGEWSVSVSLNEGEGTTEWNRLASECFYRQETCPTGQLAIVMDGVVQSAPTVQEPNFAGGSVQITGAFREQDARDLARILQFGSVNIAFDTPEVNTVSASLGEDSVDAVLISGAVGVVAVSLLLLVYYGLGALLAISALALTGGMLWTIICLISRTSGLALTLAGCAGVIVSVGLSVDSQVVLFERLKDDVVAGKPLKSSARRAVETSWRTILIANTTSLIGAGILWWLTVGTVRGFAFFLGLSILCSLTVQHYFMRPAVLLVAGSARLQGARVLGVRPPGAGRSAVRDGGGEP